MINNYQQYIAENLDKGIKYTEYVAENLDKVIEYTEYIAENLDRNFGKSGASGIPGFSGSSGKMGISGTSGFGQNWMNSYAQSHSTSQEKQLPVFEDIQIYRIEKPKPTEKNLSNYLNENFPSFHLNE